VFFDKENWTDTCHIFLWFYMIIGQYQENTQIISLNEGNTCRYSSNFPSGNTQGIRSSDEDRTDCVFPPFNLPRRTQTIPKRSCLSLNVIFWSKIQSMGSRRQSEYSRAKYVALPVVLRHYHFRLIFLFDGLRILHTGCCGHFMHFCSRLRHSGSVVSASCFHSASSVSRTEQFIFAELNSHFLCRSCFMVFLISRLRLSRSHLNRFVCACHYRVCLSARASAS